MQSPQLPTVHEWGIGDAGSAQRAVALDAGRGLGGSGWLPQARADAILAELLIQHIDRGTWTAADELDIHVGDPDVAAETSCSPWR
jgi:hypothetical protein